MIELPRREAIARRLRLSPNMVRTHKQNVQVRLGVRSDVAPVSVALEARPRPGYRRLEL
jgi:DNA-binding CsgD family transcriptional regulator